MFRKVTSLEISRSPLLTGVAGLQDAVCNATKNKVLTKFIKSALKLTENFQEVISTGAPCQRFTDLQTAAFSLVRFKAPEVASTVEFLCSEAGANGFYTE